MRNFILFNRQGLLEALGELVVSCPPQDFLVVSVDIDSRQCRQGSLFFPVLSPEPRQALNRALARGAVALVVTPDIQVPVGGRPVVVSDMRLALKRLAQFGRKRMSGPVIGVTGSVGKTTAKSLTSHLLSHAGECVETYDGWNVNFGLDVCLSNLGEHTDYAVVEIAGSGPGQIERLAPAVSPTVGVLTAIGGAHGMNFSDDYDVLLSKSRLFDYVDTAVTSSEIISWDDERDASIRRRFKKKLVSVSIESECGDVYLEDVHLGPVSSLVSARVFDETVKYILPFPGRHLVLNSLYALATASVLGLEPQRFAPAFEAWSMPEGRGLRLRVELTKDRVVEIIDDSYNASPESMKALISVLTSRKGARRRVLVFGDMLELGVDERGKHADLASYLSNSGIDHLITVGPLSALVVAGVDKNGFTHRSFPDSAAAAADILNELSSGDVVGVKGSQAVGLRKVVAAISKGSRKSNVSNHHWSIESEFGCA